MTTTKRMLLTLAMLLASTGGAGAQHAGDMLIGSTANGGGALALQYGFGPKIQLAPSLTIGGTTVYTTTDPGFDAVVADADGFHVLDDGTQVSVQLLSFDAGASVKVRSTVLDTVNESAVVGTYTGAAPDALHHHPTWTLALPNGVYGDYDLAFRLTTTSGSYTASQTYAVVLTNATPARTATPSPTPSAAAETPTATATLATPPTTTTTPTAGAATPSPTPTAEPVCAAAPLSGCRRPTVAGKSSLVLVDRSDDTKDTLQWKLAKGPATTKAELGAPLATTSYALCMYDAAGTRIAAAAIPAGGVCTGKPCWKETKVSFTYADKAGFSDGVRRLQLTAGAKAGKTSLAAKGRGPSLMLPPMPIAAASLPLVVQLQPSTGTCFETALASLGRNTAAKLTARD